MQTINTKSRGKRLKLPPDCVLWVRAIIRLYSEDAAKGKLIAETTRRRTHGELGSGQVDYWRGLISALRLIDKKIGESVDRLRFARAMTELLDATKDDKSQRA